MSLLSMHGISKRFGPALALQDVSLELDAGEVLGIVGENGAGKSTLIKVLGGAYQPDAGEIILDGEPVQIRTPHDGLSHGIAVIYQELSLVPELSVAENLFLGHLPSGPLGATKQAELNRRSQEIIDALNLDVKPGDRVASLRIGVRQLIEVGKALSRTRRARILVMDEPTSSLNEAETAQLFAVVRQLKADGIGIIYISHYLDEVFEICDRAMVMRDGKVVGVRPTDEWTPDQIVHAMVNRPIEDFYPKARVDLGEPLLEVSHLNLRDRLKDVSFSVRSGEVLGLAGLPGSGTSKLGEIVAGARRPTSGSMTLHGRNYVPRSPGKSIVAGVGYVPADRKKEGLLLDFSVAENITLSVLPVLSRLGVVNMRRKQQTAVTAIQDFGVKTNSPKTPVHSLSGGNQQKVLLARVHQPDPKLMVMNDPTRGIDVGAKVEIYERIGEFVQAGGAVLLISSELPELIGISDRIAVFREGRLVAELVRAQFSQHLIMSYAAGADETYDETYTGEQDGEQVGESA